MSVVTLPDVKDHLNISGSGSDAELTRFIAEAEAAIRQWCGPLTLESVIRTVEGERATLALPVTPADSLISVTAQPGGDALDLNSLYLSEFGVVEFIYAGWFGARRYEVAYEAGRSVVPADLLLAVKELVRHLWQSSQRGGQPGILTQSPEVAPSIPGAAYMYPHRVTELMGPHMQSGLA